MHNRARQRVSCRAGETGKKAKHDRKQENKIIKSEHDGLLNQMYFTRHARYQHKSNKFSCSRCQLVSDTENISSLQSVLLALCVRFSQRSEKIMCDIKINESSATLSIFDKNESQMFFFNLLQHTQRELFRLFSTGAEGLASANFILPFSFNLQSSS